MKLHLATIMLVSLFSLKALAQEKDESTLLVDGKLYIDSIYSNKEELILFSGVHKFEGVSQSELKNRVKNWASLKFVNLKEVLVSETDDQVVLNYITSAYYVKSLGVKYNSDWYIRLIIQFKDGRLKCTYYDDGNVRALSSQYSPGVAARTYRLKDVFKKENDKLVSPKMNTLGLINLHNSIKDSFNGIKESIEKSSTKGEDW
jgi:hypothetical protein